MLGKQQEEIQTGFGVGRRAVCADVEAMPGGLAPIPAFLRAAAPAFFQAHRRWDFYAIFSVARASIAQRAAVTLLARSAYSAGVGIFPVEGG